MKGSMSRMVLVVVVIFTVVSLVCSCSGGSSVVGEFDGEICRGADVWNDDDERISVDDALGRELDEYCVDTTNVVYGHDYQIIYQGVNIDDSIGIPVFTDDICTIIVWIDGDTPGNPGDLDLAIEWGEDDHLTRIDDIVEDDAYWPAVTAHLAKKGPADIVVIDIVYEDHSSTPVEIQHIRMTQDFENNLDNFSIIDGPDRVDGSDGAFHPDVVFNWGHNRLDCVFENIDGELQEIVYAHYDGSWTAHDPISPEGALVPLYPRLDFGIIDLDSSPIPAVVVVWCQFNTEDWDLDIYWAAWESENIATPDDLIGGFIPDPNDWDDKTSAFPFVDINPREKYGEYIENIAHIVWWQFDNNNDPDVYYVNTHNIDDIIADPDDWVYYPIEDNNDRQGLPQIAAYADDSEEGMIVFISGDNGDYQIWTAEFDYSTPSSVYIYNPTVLPDEDNEALDPEAHLDAGPSLSLCFPDEVWAAWPDERETFNWAIYGNYFDNQ